MAKKYVGSVKIELAEMTLNLPTFSPNQEPTAVPLPNDLARELVVLQSQKTLSRVVEQMKLDVRWCLSKDAAKARVKANLGAEADGTDAIIVRYRDPDSETAAAVAEGVARAYEAQGKDMADRFFRTALRSLERDIREQETRVEEARQRMLEVAERLGVTDVPSADEPLPVKGGMFNLAALLEERDEDPAAKEGKQDPALEEASREYALQRDLLAHMRAKYAAESAAFSGSDVAE